AADQPAAFVGDLVGDAGRIEAGVDFAGERFELRPDLFLAGELASLRGPQVVRRVARHLHEVIEAGPLDANIPPRVLPDLDQADRLFFNLNGSELDVVPGRVAGGHA